MAQSSEPLFVAERKEQILQMLEEQTKIYVPDLCERFGVSPVTVRKGAYTAAGSTITDEVPEDALAIARARQVNKDGWVKKNRRKDS